MLPQAEVSSIEHQLYKNERRTFEALRVSASQDGDKGTRSMQWKQRRKDLK